MRARVEKVDVLGRNKSITSCCAQLGSCTTHSVGRVINKNSEATIKMYVNSTPYMWIPNLIISQLVIRVLKWINAFPTNTSISVTLIPQAIIEL